ncbi:MAG: non-hydrolyzing UDP-N-acetylglucosamine 2-epimerase [Candidatus Kariarchaeaceae archaeon]
MKKIISVVGARPNFMKVAPIHRAFQKYSNQIDHLICHTGQHYDESMSKIFFDDLEIPKPDFFLSVGSGTHAEQTGTIMIEFEKVILKEQPNLVVVVGDVNSTIACSLTAKKLGILTAHIEAGLRSFDRDMPEEINRILTDAVCDLLFVSEQSGLINLKAEGIPDNKIFFVGNIMIDSIIHFVNQADSSNILEKFHVDSKQFVLVTLHRPSNVDHKRNLSRLVDLLNNISEIRKVIFPIHPRSKKNMEEYGLIASLNKDVILTEPIGYIEFMKLLKNAELILTDSGGIQEESTFLGVQCITLRKSTERPVTVEIGTNHLVGDDPEEAERIALSILHGSMKKGEIPQKWDGKTAERIVDIIKLKLL